MFELKTERSYVLTLDKRGYDDLSNDLTTLSALDKLSPTGRGLLERMRDRTAEALEEAHNDATPGLQPPLLPVPIRVADEEQKETD